VSIASESDDEIFHVHKKLICASSQFFAAATKPEWTGTTPKPIELHDATRRDFEAYLKWLYTEQVGLLPRDKSQFPFLTRCYVLGEMLIDPGYQNAIICAIINYSEKVNMVPDIKEVRRIYEGTSELSPARKLMVDFWAWYAKPSWDDIDNLSERVCVDFVNDLAVAMITYRARPGVTSENSSLLPRPETNPESYFVKETAQGRSGSESKKDATKKG
jgi:hypothetical protein